MTPIAAVADPNTSVLTCEPRPRAPGLRLPPGACDSHVHAKWGRVSRAGNIRAE